MIQENDPTAVLLARLAELERRHQLARRRIQKLETSRDLWRNSYRALIVDLRSAVGRHDLHQGARAR